MCLHYLHARLKPSYMYTMYMYMYIVHVHVFTGFITYIVYMYMYGLEEAIRCSTGKRGENYSSWRIQPGFELGTF